MPWRDQDNSIFLAYGKAQVLPFESRMNSGTPRGNPGIPKGKLPPLEAWSICLVFQSVEEQVGNHQHDEWHQPRAKGHQGTSSAARIAFCNERPSD